MGLEELPGRVQGWVRCWRFAGAKKGASRAADDAGAHAVFFVRFIIRLLHMYICVDWGQAAASIVSQFTFQAEYAFRHGQVGAP